MDKINELLKKAGKEDLNVVEEKVGSKTVHGNAYVVGVCSARKVAIQDTLIEKFEEKQVIAIVPKNGKEKEVEKKSKLVTTL